MATIQLPQPYDFQLSTGRFRAFGPDQANLWLDGALYRAVDGREVRIAAAPGGVEVDPLDEGVRDTVLTLLGAPFDLEPFRDFAAADGVLSRIVAALPGLRPPLAPDPFEALVTAVTAQQVSLHAAFAIRNRFIVRFGTACSRVYAFPTRARVAEASPDELTSLGFSRRKAEYVVELAQSELALDALGALSDEQVKLRLVALRGIGEWTADWFLARHLARPTAWPAGDLGLRKAVNVFFGRVDDVRAFGDRFAPFQNLSAHYLLAALLSGVRP